VDRTQAALGAQAVLTQAGWVGVRLMIGYRAIELGADTFALGVLAASFAAPALVASLPLGRVADRRGGAVLSFVGALLALAGTLGSVLLSDLWTLVGAGAVVGLGHVGVMIGQQSLVAAQSHASSSDSAFGNLTAAASIGQLIGPPAVTVAAGAAWLATGAEGPDAASGLLVAGAFTAAALPMFLVLRRGRTSSSELTSMAAVGSANLLRTPGLWRSLVVSGAVLVTVDLLYAFIPAWATQRGIDVRTVGILLALRAAVSVVSRVGLSRLVARFGRRNLVLVSVLAAAGGLCLLPFGGTTGAVVAMVGLGLGLGIPQPLTMVWVTRLTDPSRHGAVLGLRMSVNRLAQITLPLAIGAVAAPLGASAVFVANAALLAGALLALPRSTDLA
jgi:MFS family permease